MIAIGLTGSIAMGKSTVAAMFQAAGAPVFDSDSAVHALYRSEAAREIEEAFPGVVVDGAVDRLRLAPKVLNDIEALRRLEAIIHPKVAQARRDFIKACAAQGRRIVIADVPLLFESSSERSVDVIVVVSAPESVQKARALARKDMTPERLTAILAKQTPDREKRRRAHFVLETNCSLEATRAQTLGLLRCLAAMTGRKSNANA